ncbi:ACP S-malonyltransferase [Roseomonas sp. NAR14]|uniref:Malonyl CoA-acyl carrier protein transacylase n=1 Tax=Roseomonas acroporae TaxID=2937791 RepID=A0A9X1Y7X6_9PROT|nr:ACP S-malonyltransferase [Roseomonas acroporae]MCK8785559.1 ACP S-malonyltransferase [Roseomonas acroporae]
MALALLFPGQGSQAVGMGHALAEAFPAAREVFQEVDDALGQHLSRLMFEGPAEELTLTANAQPALLAVSVAVLRVLEREGGFRLPEKVALVAGHSLGEYSALTAAGALDLATAARLLRRRGEAMQKAVPAGEGAMAALLGADLAQARAICERAAPAPDGRTEVVECANDNGGGQVVVSGHKAAVERAVELAKAEGIRRAMLLPVSAPFHSALMAPAAHVMEEALARAELRAPLVPVVANVTAAKVTDPHEIRRLLVEQVTATVRWRESIEAMSAMGCDRFAELGAGRVLTGLMKRLAPEAKALSVGNPVEIEAFLKAV